MTVRTVALPVWCVGAPLVAAEAYVGLAVGGNASRDVVVAGHSEYLGRVRQPQSSRGSVWTAPDRGRGDGAIRLSGRDVNFRGDHCHISTGIWAVWGRESWQPKDRELRPQAQDVVARLRCEWPECSAAPSDGPSVGINAKWKASRRPNPTPARATCRARTRQTYGLEAVRRSATIAGRTTTVASH